jgi:DNA repair protein RadB
MLALPEPINSLIKSIEPSAVTNFYGGPGTGKTNLCMLSAIDCIRKNGSVIFIDTEGGFSLERLKQLAPEYQGILKKIVLLQPKSFSEQGRIIRELEKQGADLIILDSAVALYRLEYADAHANGNMNIGDIEKNEAELSLTGLSHAQHGNTKSTEVGNNIKPRTEKLKSKAFADSQILAANRELSKQLSILSNIAREKNIPVVITAHTFKNFRTGEDDMIGGEMIKYWSKAIVFLERTGKTSERKATVFKHRSLPEGSSAKFEITGSGIKPSGFKIF